MLVPQFQVKCKFYGAHSLSLHACTCALITQWCLCSRYWLAEGTCLENKHNYLNSSVPHGWKRESGVMGKLKKYLYQQSSSHSRILSLKPRMMPPPLEEYPLSIEPPWKYPKEWSVDVVKQVLTDFLARSDCTLLGPKEKADLTRILLLNTYGGIWVDTDDVLLRDLRQACKYRLCFQSCALEFDCHIVAIQLKFNHSITWQQLLKTTFCTNTHPVECSNMNTEWSTELNLCLTMISTACSAPWVHVRCGYFKQRRILKSDGTHLRTIQTTKLK